MSLTRREELQKLTVKKGLRPIAKNFQIEKYSSMNKNILIDSILDFERPKLCVNCGRLDPNKTNFITCVNVIICKYCCTPYDYI